MKQTLHKISLLIIFISLLSCSVKQPSLFNRTDPPKRYDLHGFSLMHPQEGNWIISSKADDEITLQSGDKNTFVTYIAQAAIMRIKERYTNEEFKKFIESNYLWGKENKNKRYSIVRENYSVSNEINTFCIRYYSKVKDYSPKVPVNGDYFISENEGLICRHPENTNIAVTFEFSKRYLPENPPNVFPNRAQHFFKNIKLEPLFPHTNILTYGLYKKNSGGKPVKVDGTENEYIQTADFDHIETTRDIPANLETYFGFEFEFSNLPPGEEIKVDIFIIHPPLKITAEAAVSTEDSYWIRTTIPEDGKFKSGEWFGLTSDTELVPGKWIYRYYIDQEQVLEQEFFVYNPEENK